MTLWDRLIYPFRSGPRRPLAARQPHADRNAPDVPLGMEATDIASVAKVNRHNDALERATGNAVLRQTGAKDPRNSASHVAPMPEDETYAARYHRAFQQKGS